MNKFENQGYYPSNYGGYPGNTTITTDTVTWEPIVENKRLGWTCPSCGVNHRPEIDRCECSKIFKDINQPITFPYPPNIVPSPYFPSYPLPTDGPRDPMPWEMPYISCGTSKLNIQKCNFTN